MARPENARLFKCGITIPNPAWSVIVTPIIAGSPAHVMGQGMAKTVDVAEIIGKQKFGGFQLRIVILCGLIQFLDGFDTQALAYAAPALRAAWHVTPPELGRVF